MAMRLDISLVLSAFIIAIICMNLHPTQGCSPIPGQNYPIGLEYKMKDSDIVVSGIPRHHHRDNRYPHDEVFMVDFEVRCVFKGAPLPEMIRIYEVGSIAGLCLSTEMPKNKSLLIYLEQKDAKTMVPRYREDPGGIQYLEEIMVLCETEVSYPIGATETRNKEMCPEPYEYDDCVAIPTSTVPPPPEMETSASPSLPLSDNVKDDNMMDTKPAKGADTSPEDNVPYEPVKSGDTDSGDKVVDASMGGTGGNKGTSVGDDGGQNEKDGSPSTFTFNLLLVAMTLTSAYVFTV